MSVERNSKLDRIARDDLERIAAEDPEHMSPRKEVQIKHAMQRLPTGNVEWTRLDDKAVIELVRVGKSENRVYIATLPSGESALVNWEGRHAANAMSYLDRRCDK